MRDKQSSSIRKLVRQYIKSQERKKKNALATESGKLLELEDSPEKEDSDSSVSLHDEEEEDEVHDMNDFGLLMHQMNKPNERRATHSINKKYASSASLIDEKEKISPKNNELVKKKTLQGNSNPALQRRNTV